MTDLTDRARALSRHEHDDASIGDEYAARDHQSQGEHYLRHLLAMTAEGLHTKSAIAGELAHRDIEIKRLTAERDAANAEKKALQEDLASEKKWGELWYFVSDEEPLAFETIVSQWSPSRWIDQAYKLMAARALRKGMP